MIKSKCKDFIDKFWLILSKEKNFKKEETLNRLKVLKKFGDSFRDGILKKGGHRRTDLEAFVISYLAWYDNYKWSSITVEELERRLRKIQKEFKASWVETMKKEKK